MKKLGWLSVVRLGLVQACLGAVIVLMTSTLNRIMVVELALPAIVPGALITLHHVMQVLRPRMGFGSDVGQRRTPWIVGGMTALTVGGFGAAIATTLVRDHFALGMALAVAAFALIGAGVSAAGTSLLVLLAKRVAEERRAAAATIVWMMMIAGFAVTATLSGRLLDPFSNARLLTVFGCVSAAALLVTLLAIAGVEGPREELLAAKADESKPRFMAALRETWSDPDARRFTVFVFVSMLAYSAQDLIMEPFAGAIFRFTPGESTKLSGTQHGGVFAGMVLVAVVTMLFKNTPFASIKAWVVGGCLASSAAMCGLVIAGLRGGDWPLRENVFLLGVANGAFAISAIGAMMTLAGQGKRSREGVRMGLWGASQAISFGLGGFLGTVLVDVAKPFTHEPAHAYAFVFGIEAVAFFAAHLVALGTRFKAPVPTLRVDGREHLA